ncbi:MAG: methyl-accepting chemotaxis protein [Synergistaceae bacterium]|nr:methyl-accepting chemotaxis protein [Synergistaceae bacterium]
MRKPKIDSIENKLAFAFSTVVLIAFLLGLTGTMGANRLSNLIKNIASNRFEDMRSLATLNYERVLVRTQAYEALLAKDKPHRDQELKNIIGRRKGSLNRVEVGWETLLSSPRYSEKEKEHLEDLMKHYAKWLNINNSFTALLERIVDAGTEKEKAELFSECEEMSKELVVASDLMGDAFLLLTYDNNRVTKQIVEEGLKAAEVSRNLSFATMFLGVFVTIIITVGLTRSLIRPINASVALLTRLRDGDLRMDISPDILSRGDELGDLAKAVQELTISLREQIASMKEMAVALAKATSEISESVSSVTAAAQEAGAAVVQTSATIEEVRTTAEVTSKRSSKVAESAQQGLQEMQRGKVSTETLFSGIKLIRERMTSIAETIIQLSEQSQEVGEITGTVEDLAEQSNLLAINAAVEAAKAGDQGRGFSVVAQEIKSLAEQSKQSAKEVQRILRDIQKATSASVMAIEQGSKAVEEGAQDAAPSQELIQKITSNFVESAQSAAQIAAANNELLAGIDQVTQAMESIKAGGEHNVVRMKELEASSAGLREMGQKLSILVEGYLV